MNHAACAARYGNAVSEHRIRQVWAAVTANPRLSIPEIAKQLDYHSVAQIHAALHILRDAGYIAFADRACRARTVLVPFYVQHTTSMSIAS